MKVAFQRGRFSFRPYPPPPKSRPLRRSAVAGFDEPQPEQKIDADSCYHCARAGEEHDRDCPRSTWMRAGECWLVMGRHFEVVKADDFWVFVRVAYVDPVTTYSREALDRLMVRPRRIHDCACAHPHRAHERIGW